MIRSALISFVTSFIALLLLSVFSPVVLADIGDGTWTHIIRQAPSEGIKTIYVSPDGSLWAGTGGALYRCFNGRWERKQSTDGQLQNFDPFVMDASGRFFCIDDGSLVIWDKGNCERFNDVTIGNPARGAFTSDGVLYIGSYSSYNGGLFRFDGSKVVKLNDDRIRSVTVDNMNRLWTTALEMGSDTMKLKVLDSGVWTDRSDDVEFCYPVLTNELTVQTAPNGSVWVCNQGKIGIYRDEAWTFFDGGRAPMFLFFDSTGGVWGHGNSRIYRLEPSTKQWKALFVQENAIASSPHFMAELPDGSLWVFSTQYIYRFKGTFFEKFESPNDLADNTVTCLAYWTDGTLVAGHGRRDVTVEDRSNKGISIRKNGMWECGLQFGDVEFTNMFQAKNLPDGDIMTYTDGGFKWLGANGWAKVDSLYVGNQTDMVWNGDTMWITTTRGLLEYLDGSEFDYYFPLGGGTAYVLKNLAINSNKVLYMQSERNNIITYDGTEWVELFKADRFTNDIAIDADDILWAARLESLSWWNTVSESWIDVEPLYMGLIVEIDPQNRVWVGSKGKTGYYEDGVFHTIAELSGLSCNAIAFSNDGRVAVNAYDYDYMTFYGIYEFQPRSKVSDNNKPVSFIPSSTHPNPFNPATTISFELPAASHTTIDIYAANGQLVERIADHYFPTGKSRVLWDTAKASKPVATGIYFYRIRAGKLSATGKMTLIK